MLLVVNREWQNNSEARKTVKRLLPYCLARPNSRYSKAPEHREGGVEIVEEVIWEESGSGDSYMTKGNEKLRVAHVYHKQPHWLPLLFIGCASWDMQTRAAFGPLHCAVMLATGVTYSPQVSRQIRRVGVTISRQVVTHIYILGP